MNYQLLINGRKKVGIKKLKNSKAFIDYSQIINNVYKNLENYNATKKSRVLIVFDDMKADLESNKKWSAIVPELSLRGRKLNISFVFISQSYFKEHNTIRMNAAHCFIMQILNKRELQQIASNYSSDNDFKDFMKLYKYYIEEPYSFLVDDNLLRLRISLL